MDGAMITNEPDSGVLRDWAVRALAGALPPAALNLPAQARPGLELPGRWRRCPEEQG